MAIPTYTAIPTSFRAGNTLKYTRTYADFPANGGWALTLYLKGAGSFSVAASASGASFSVTVPASQTATVSSVADAATTAGSKTLTKAAGSFITAGVRPGDLVTGPGIPRGAYVDAAYPVAAGSLTLSEAALATATGLAVIFRFPDGTYQWIERVVSGIEAYDASFGTVIVEPDLAGLLAGEGESREARWLKLVDDVIEGRMSVDAAAYQIGPRAKTFEKISDWLNFRNELAAKVAQQANSNKFLVARGGFTGPDNEA